MMHLYLLRHGIAEEHSARPSDAERKLVPEGKEKTRLAVQAISAMNYPAPELVIASPLVRARETAEVAIEVFGSNVKLKESSALVPSADMIETMALVEESFRKHKVVMFV